MNANSFYITDGQRQTLAGYLSNGDRTGFYVELHRMTGSQAALDMNSIAWWEAT